MGEVLTFNNYKPNKNLLTARNVSEWFLGYGVARFVQTPTTTSDSSSFHCNLVINNNYKMYPLYPVNANAYILTFDIHYIAE